MQNQWLTSKICLYKHIHIVELCKQVFDGFGFFAELYFLSEKVISIYGIAY